MIGPESFLNGELSSHVLSCTFQKMCNFFLNRYSCCVYRGQGKLFCLRNLTYCPGFKRAKSYCIYILYDDNFLTCHKMVWSKYTRKYKPHRYNSIALEIIKKELGHTAVSIALIAYCTCTMQYTSLSR